MNHLLVTGGAGYIGAVCVEALLRRGWRLTVLDNFSTGHRAAVPPGVDVVDVDLCDRRRVLDTLAAVQPQAVIHFAAAALVGESMVDPSKYFLNNVVGSAHLLEGMARQGVRRLIVSSTCAVYGTPSRLPLTEDSALAPVNPYGESKLAVERMIQWHRDIHGLVPTIFRYFNAAGATDTCGEDHDPETHLVANVLKVAAGHQPSFALYGDDYPTPDGTCIRDFVHVRDIAEAHILALEQEVEGVFNLGSGSGNSIQQVLALARGITGHTIPVSLHPRRPGDPAELWAESRSAQDALGWTPGPEGLAGMVRDAWKWMARHPRGWRSTAPMEEGGARMVEV